MTYFSHLSLTGNPPRLIGFVGFDGISTVDLTGPLDAFAAARNETGEPCYETALIGVENRNFESSSGVSFKAQYTLANAPILDTIVIPGGSGLVETELSRSIGNWLRTRSDNTRRFASVSSGIYPLAQSGLLQGRRATTHWRYAQNVARAFRGVEISDTGSFIKDDCFYTSGGGVAGIEMTLAMIQEDHGARIALRLARELVVSLRPSSADERPLDPAEPSATEERLAELPAWITSRLRANLSVEVLAERTCLCPRHFSRLFKKNFHVTPAEFVEHLRITEAARRLVARPVSVDGVADSVGFKSADVFRRAFERRFGISPKKFQMRSRGETNRRATRAKAA